MSKVTVSVSTKDGLIQKFNLLPEAFKKLKAAWSFMKNDPDYRHRVFKFSAVDGKAYLIEVNMVLDIEEVKEENSENLNQGVCCG